MIHRGPFAGSRQTLLLDCAWDEAKDSWITDILKRLNKIQHT